MQIIFLVEARARKRKEILKIEIKFKGKQKEKYPISGEAKTNKKLRDFYRFARGTYKNHTGKRETGFGRRKKLTPSVSLCDECTERRKKKRRRKDSETRLR